MAAPTQCGRLTPILLSRELRGDGMSDELVSVQTIKIEPNNCPLEEELGLGIDFTLKRPLPSASWQIRFIADTASARKIIELGATASEDYLAGANSMRFRARPHPRIATPRHIARHRTRHRHGRRRWAR